MHDSESKTFSLLILDMKKISPRIRLKTFLRQIPAQYCIVLNAKPQDIKNIRRKYRVARDEFFYESSSTYTPPPCVVLSYKGGIDYLTNPAQISWDTIDNNPCLHIQIQGVNLLLTYLDPLNSKRRKDLLQVFENDNFLDECGRKADLHLLIAYLDTKRALEPDILTPRYRWQYVHLDDDRDVFSLSSFHILANTETTNVQWPVSTELIVDTGYEIPSSVGIITYIPCLLGWEAEHLKQCFEHDYSPNNTT
jgi:hypothetical protein